MHLKPPVVVVVFGCYGSHHTHKGLKITISGVIKQKKKQRKYLTGTQVDHLEPPVVVGYLCAMEVVAVHDRAQDLLSLWP